MMVILQGLQDLITNFLCGIAFCLDFFRDWLPICIQVGSHFQPVVRFLTVEAADVESVKVPVVYCYLPNFEPLAAGRWAVVAAFPLVV